MLKRKKDVIYSRLSNKYKKNRKVSIISQNSSDNIAVVFQRMMKEDKPTCRMEYRLGMKTTKLMLNKKSALVLADIILAHYYDKDNFDNDKVVELIHSNKFKIQTVEDH